MTMEQNKTTDDQPGSGKRTGDGRFRKGHSGNPAGRPRNLSRDLTPWQIREDFMDIAELPIKFRLGGRAMTVPGIKAVFLKLMQQAADGDFKSQRLFVDMVRRVTDEHDEAQARLLGVLLDTEKGYERAKREYPEKRKELDKQYREFMNSPPVNHALDLINHLPPKSKLHR